MMHSREGSTRQFDFAYLREENQMVYRLDAAAPWSVWTLVERMLRGIKPSELAYHVFATIILLAEKLPPTPPSERMDVEETRPYDRADVIFNGSLLFNWYKNQNGYHLLIEPLQRQCFDKDGEY